ncbi:serine-rich adhesin for platelets-like, partial [Saccostrea cucullata]|uniref:serine-rich adhesin for platelets-like n=1 Tax=Saccostrea cuccullata TaxID=36930 RepID=UPI002ED4E168
MCYWYQSSKNMTGKSQTPLEAQIGAPTTIDIQNELSVKCAPSGSFDFISKIEIQRKNATASTYSTILVVEDPPRGSAPVFRDDEVRERASAQGRAGRPSDAFLTLTIPQGQVNCNDGGSYQCQIVNGDNGSTTITSIAVTVTIQVSPDASRPVLSLSPSNFPGAGVSVYTYLKGTTIMLVCQADVGSPPQPMRFCYQPTGVSTFTPVTNVVSNIVAPQSVEPAKSCLLTRTIVASAEITALAGSFYCEVHAAGTSQGCGTNLKVTDAMFTAQNLPVCNSSTITCSSSSTTSTTTTTSTTSSTSSTTSTTTEASIEGDVQVLAVTDNGGYTLLLLGCGLIVVSGVLFATSLIIFMKAKKLKKGAEMAMIRSTYDSVHFRRSSAPNYTSL